MYWAGSKFAPGLEHAQFTVVSPVPQSLLQYTWWSLMWYWLGSVSVNHVWAPPKPIFDWTCRIQCQCYFLCGTTAMCWTRSEVSSCLSDVQLDVVLLVPQPLPQYIKWCPVWHSGVSGPWILPCSFTTHLGVLLCLCSWSDEINQQDGQFFTCVLLLSSQWTSPSYLTATNH